MGVALIRRKRWLRTPMLMVALMCIIAMADHAAAQGTFGTLPEPISSRDLDRYAEQLNLSDQQVLAIAEHHREYLNRFRELRDSDIDTFLAGMQNMRRNFSIGNLSRFEPMIRDINRLMGRIRTADEQFFNQMHTLLTDEQARKLPRLRQHRERSRYASELTRGLDFINPGARLDLTEILEQIDLPPHVLERIDPQVAQYESRLTAMARTMWDTTMKVFIDAIREIDALGLDEDQLSEPAQLMRLFQEAQRIWDEVSEDLLKESAKLAALHRHHYRAIAPLLPDEARRSFRLRFLRQAYSEAAQLTVEPWREVEKTLSLDDLPVRLRTSVLAMANNHDQQQERRMNQIADLLDEFRSSLTVQSMIRRGQDPTMQRVSELREEGERADEQFIENLHALLGQEWSARVKAAPAPRSRSATSAPPRFVRAFSFDESSPQPGIRWPRPISAHDLSRIGQMLEPDDNAMTVLESLHEDYSAAFNDARRHHMPGITQMMIEPDDDVGGFTRVLDDDELDELIGLMRAAMDDVRRIERDFFDDVGSALLGRNGDERLDKVRAMRECLLHLESTPVIPPRLLGGPVNNPGNTEAGVRFREIVRELSLGSEHRRDVERTIINHELAIRDLLRDRFDIDVEVSLRNWQIALRMQNPDRRGRAWQAMGALREPAQRSQSINREIALLNRGVLDATINVLPAHEQSTLRDRYNRQAFSVVYDDPTTPEQKLMAAMNLAELSDRQRGRLQDLMMEFRVEYQRLSQQMVDHYMELSKIQFPEGRGGPRPGQAEPPEIVERDGHRNMIERFEFERGELNRRIARQLRAILNEEQYRLLSTHAGG